SINRRLGEILINMADEFAESWETDAADRWRAEIESVDEEVDTAWRTVSFARESWRTNPRRLTAGRRRRTTARRDIGYEDILPRVDETVSHLRHLIRTLRDADYSEGSWDDTFREKWSAVARDAGHKIADPDAEVDSISDRLDAVARTMSDENGLPRRTWPLYGSLITSM